MENWFTVEPIDSDTFIISEYKHWEETHCYLLCGTKKALLIDTGLGIENIKKVVENLTALPVSVLTTHAHWDHIFVHDEIFQPRAGRIFERAVSRDMLFLDHGNFII